MAWYSGAKSLENVNQRVYQFKVPKGVSGVVSGVGRDRPGIEIDDPASVEFGVHVSAGEWQAVAYSSLASDSYSFPQDSDLQLFSVHLHGDHVLVVADGDSQHVHPETGIVYTGSLLFSGKRTGVDEQWHPYVAFRRDFDRIYSPESKRLTFAGGATGSFGLKASGIGEDANVLFATMPAPSITALESSPGLQIKMPGIAANGREDDGGILFVGMPAPSLGLNDADFNTPISGADIQFPAIKSVASGLDHRESGVDETLPVPRVYTGDADGSASIKMPPILASAIGESGILGARIVGIMPSFYSRNYPPFGGIESVAQGYAEVSISAGPFPESLAQAEARLFGHYDSSLTVTSEAAASAATAKQHTETVTVTADAVAEAGGTGAVPSLVANAYADASYAGSHARTSRLAESQAEAESDAIAVSLELVDSSADADSTVMLWRSSLLEAVAYAEDEAIYRTGAPLSVIEANAFADDEYLINAQATKHVEVEAIATDEALFKNPGAWAWVMNTETGAPSTYTNWQIVDMAQFGGKVIGVGPEGVVQISGGDDAGESIDACVQYGFFEMQGFDRDGNPRSSIKKSRVDSLWMGYQADAELEMTVETYGQGLPPFTYAMDRREADAPISNRIKVGKGIHARYWRLAFHNTNGAGFSVYSIAAESASSNRRL